MLPRELSTVESLPKGAMSVEGNKTAHLNQRSREFFGDSMNICLYLKLKDISIRNLP